MESNNTTNWLLLIVIFIMLGGGGGGMVFGPIVGAIFIGTCILIIIGYYILTWYTRNDYVGKGGIFDFPNEDKQKKSPSLKKATANSTSQEFEMYFTKVPHKKSQSKSSQKGDTKPTLKEAEIYFIPTYKPKK